ncbi:MAG: DUF1385 domain-containing protein [Chloroflexi bacterium]|jgi:uncharacterized protein YqhQ|nr:DUF1385 domain-containing protein [Chloroflexota bacterium]
MSDKLPSYGGQAVIEGVMMRGASSVAIAMRDPDQKIIIHTEELGGIYKSKISKIPFLRGLILLWDALGLGMRALTISANAQTGEDEQLEGPALYLTLAFSLTFSIVLFFIAPATVGNLVERWWGVQPWVSNLAEGFVRLALLIGYVGLIGLMPDIKRVFMYHGAEHKTINAFECNIELTPENVAQQSIEHPRCGTAFLLTLMLLSVLIYSLLGNQTLAARLLSRVALIPVLAGIAYEYIRWTANHLDSAFVRWMIKPNLALQRLTTREPSLEIIEVGIAAFEAMRAKELDIVV